MKENYHQILGLSRRSLNLIETLRRQADGPRLDWAERNIREALAVLKHLLKQLGMPQPEVQETIPFHTPRGGLLTEAIETLESAKHTCDAELIPGQMAWPVFHDLLLLRQKLVSCRIWIESERGVMRLEKDEGGRLKDEEAKSSAQGAEKLTTKDTKSTKTKKTKEGND